MVPFLAALGLGAPAASAQGMVDEVAVHIGCDGNPDSSPYCTDPDIRALVYQQFRLRDRIEEIRSDPARANIVFAVMDGIRNMQLIAVRSCGGDTDCIKSAVTTATDGMYEISQIDRLPPLTEAEIAAFAAAERGRADQRPAAVAALQELDQAYAREWEAAMDMLNDQALPLFRFRHPDPEIWARQWAGCGPDPAACLEQKTASLNAMLEAREKAHRQVRAQQRNAENQQRQQAEAEAQAARAAASARAEEELQAQQAGADLAERLAREPRAPEPVYTREETPEWRAHMEYERLLRDIALEEGSIYRGPWFWAEFEDPTTIRTAFTGNRGSLVDNALIPAGHHFRSNPYLTGTPIQHAAVFGWARAYDMVCGDSLPANAPLYESTHVETVNTALISRYGSMPIQSRTTERTTRLRLQPDFHPAFMSAMGDQRDWIAEGRSAGSVMRELATDGGAGLLRGGAVINDTYLRLSRDMQHFLQLAGCDSLTTEQMTRGITAMAWGISAAPQDLAQAGAAEASDPAPVASEYRTFKEICNWTSGEYAPYCVCLDGMVDRLILQSGADPAVMPPQQRFDLYRQNFENWRTDIAACRRQGGLN